MLPSAPAAPAAPAVPPTTPPARPRPTVREARSLDRAGDWDRLADGAPLASPFLKSWWLTAVADRNARYLLVLEDDRLLGGLAVRRSRRLGVPVYTALGAGRLCPDHIDLVAEPGRADDVVAALRDWFTRPGNRVVDLDGLHERARVVDALPGAALTTTDLGPWEPLPADPADYYRARTRTFAKRTGKKQRRAERAGTVFRRLPDAEVAGGLDDLWSLHAVRRDRRPLLRWSPQIRRAVLAGTSAGEVRIHVAERDGARCGVLLSFTTGGRLSTYQIARRLEPDHADVGNLLYAAAIEDACRDGLTELDLLRGAEPYKLSFASEARAVVRARAAHGPGARLVLRLVVVAERARRAAGAAVRRLRSRGLDD
ncbi:CelD/BcsL family acetyltransferase involved in cellulose biosynthesis [Nocardioides thalensis]|uniref:CelD/BcsL family acetyltransferase involved in cellulose biosynthesis n=1 Tax=Nocardioides thalensis TaxID=1914755 RepID=A0A853BZ18_9ACTN|nr:GNAT family N-acetyltransferase [Nocardioides thalensis]NYJ00107.1 CelD/BcsL family acetyltransferase involved in cellulose biosynthesis [Nocardioides thalensis]